MLQTRFNFPAIYNPANQTKEELIANFVVRLKEFNTIFDVIKKDEMKTPPQHFIIQGPRGSGKTTLLLRIFYVVADDKKLEKFLIPVIFDEEQYNIRTLFRFWEEIALYLEEEHESLFHGLFDEMQKYIEKVDYEEICFSLLQQRLQESRRKLVLFIDNFGDMLAKFRRKERQRLREVLIQCNNIRIVGASSMVLEFHYDYSEPFFEFFKVIPLEGLSQKETEELLLQLSETYKTETLKQIVKSNPGRIEALRRLTSGVPRTIILLFEIFLDHEKGDSFQDLEIILDRVTPLYKHRMDGLPPQKQDIIDAIALSWDAVGVKEIVKKTRISSKAVSAHLNELEKNRIIAKIPTSTKNNLYQVAERFFNIWYLMRHGRKRERNKVLWLVRFLESWCNQITHNKKNIDYVKIDKIASSPPPYTTEYHTGTNSLKELQESLKTNEIEKAIDMFNKFIESEETLNLDKELESILLFLLAKRQFHFTYKLFKENKFDIKDKFKPIYYALVYFMRDTYPDEYKKMGPELKLTVEEIIKKIKQLSIDYQ
ncbi:MAG: ATPase [Candidatus Aminicenantes bacterium]|jgi:DNA-binding transcriptional regulator GbsR (MarR family)